ncbi:MAG: hypothetical protein QNI86_02265 [Halieaceae bacterium]|nr:hypothetical protein [Halieaceae bacterium]
MKLIAIQRDAALYSDKDLLNRGLQQKSHLAVTNGVRGAPDKSRWDFGKPN